MPDDKKPDKNVSELDKLKKENEELKKKLQETAKIAVRFQNKLEAIVNILKM